jgi:hypothetical protein
MNIHPMRHGRQDNHAWFAQTGTSLHKVNPHDRPVPAKGSDEVGPDHHSLTVRIQAPLRPCLVVALPPQPLAGCSFGCTTLCGM